MWSLSNLPASLSVPSQPLLPCSPLSNHSRIFWFSQVYQTYSSLQGYLYLKCLLPQMISPEILTWLAPVHHLDLCSNITSLEKASLTVLPNPFLRSPTPSQYHFIGPILLQNYIFFASLPSSQLKGKLLF